MVEAKRKTVELNMQARFAAKVVLLLIIVMPNMALALPRFVAPDSLIVVSDSKHVKTELYFGLSRKGGPDVSEEEFQRFIDEFVTSRFPSGLTVVDARGQWREGDQTITKERSKLLILIYPRKERREASRKIDEIRAEYKKRFSQDSVLRLDQTKGISVLFR